MNEVNESGRCPFHPSMQLQSRKKNGEWRVLMDQCPLCISGLPGDGQSIEERYAEPPAPRQSELEDAESYDDDSCYDEQENRGSNEEQQARLSPQPTRGNQKSSVKGRPRSPAQFQQQIMVPTKKGPPQQQSLELTKVNSYDSGATTDDDASSSNVCEDFRAFLQIDQQKMMAPASPKRKNNNMGSPGHVMNGVYGSPKPRPNSPLSYSPNGRQMGQSPTQIRQRRFPPPPHGMHQIGTSARSNISPNPQSQMKRPDPESSPIPHQQHHLGRGFRTPQSQQHQQKQRHSPYIAECYDTPNKLDPDEVSIHSAQYKTPRANELDEVSISSSSRYKTPRASESDEISAASMNSVKRSLHKSPHNPSLSPYTPNENEDLYTNEHSTPKLLDQDEVSAVSMSSVTRNLYTKPNDSTEDDEEASASPEDKEIVTAQCDAKGKCIRHPTVRLRKKKLFGGWQVVLSNCPECCLDEMRRVKEERSRSGKSKSGSSRCGSEAESRGGKSKSSSKAGKKKKKDKRRERERKEPPMSQVNFASNGEDDNKSIGTASTITISSYTHASGGKPYPNEKNGPARVTRMPYTDRNGERGWYTGAVDGTTGTPHGFGTMNYSDGGVFEGQWLNGKSVTTEHQIHSPVKLRYPQQSHGVRRTNPPTPRSPLETHYEDDSNLSRSHSARSRSTSRPRVRPLPQQQHHHQQHDTQMMQPQRKVVCGMPWTDSAGSGAYTGEVNGLNIPEGVGSMRYNSGFVAEGLWRDGEMEEDANDEDELMSYQEGGQLDGFLGRNNVRVRGNSGSASVM